MSLVRGCSQRAQAVARGSLRTVAGHGSVPSAGLAFENVSDEVELLQWDLAYLGFMNADAVSAGGGRFGPLTQDALTAFQNAKGLPATGAYGDLTANALVQSLQADPVNLPARELDTGAESDEVARVQTALQQLAYTDFVTGYYGPITADAVSKFQEDNGIEQTSAYGPITRMAIAARMRPPVAREDVPPEAVLEEPASAPMNFAVFIDMISY
jgi:peptidoglycan hydrolase-like protein with peptidoglycan-binding domain